MKKVDTRQSVFRGTLQEIFPYTPGQSLDTLLSSINTDLTAPLTVDASSTPDRVVHIDGSSVANTISNRNKSISFINNLIPAFSSGTVTFPAANGGTITPSPGTPSTLTLPSGQYAQALLSLDQMGNIIVTVGTPTGSLPATVPPPTSNTLPFAYVTLHNTGGTVDNIVQSSIFQVSNPANTSGITSIGTIDSQTAQANGLDIVGNVLYAQSASISNPGLVNTGTQSFAGNKTFTGTIAASNLSGTNTGNQTITLTGAVTGSGTGSFATTKQAVNFVVTGSTTNFAITTSSTPVSVIQTLLSITTTGRPVWIGCAPDGSVNDAVFQIVNNNAVQATAYAYIYRDGSEIVRFPLINNAGVNSGNSTTNSMGSIAIPSSSIQTLDTSVTAGGHTYQIYISVSNGGMGVPICNLLYTKVIAYEL